jgi:hypothetical protein
MTSESVHMQCGVLAEGETGVQDTPLWGTLPCIHFNRERHVGVPGGAYRFSTSALASTGGKSIQGLCGPSLGSCWPVLLLPLK